MSLLLIGKKAMFLELIKDDKVRYYDGVIYYNGAIPYSGAIKLLIKDLIGIALKAGQKHYRQKVRNLLFVNGIKLFPSAVDLRV